MNGLQKCLVCYSDSVDELSTTFLKDDETKCFGNSGQLSDEVSVIFVVKNILQVPNSVCERFLRDLGNPSSWGLTYCSECMGILKDAKSLAETIHNLQAKFRQCQNNVVASINTSYDSAGRPPIRNCHKNLEALDEIRYVIANEDLYREEESEYFENNYADDDYASDANQDINFSPSASESDVENTVQPKKKWKKKNSGVVARKSLRVETQAQRKAKLQQEIKQKLKDMKLDLKFVIPPIIPLKTVKPTADVVKKESANVENVSNEHQIDQKILTDVPPTELALQELEEPNINSIREHDDSNESTGDNLGNEVEEHEGTTITIKPMTDDIFLNEEEIIEENTLKNKPEADLTEEERLLLAFMATKHVAKKTPTGKRIRHRKPYTDEEKPFKCTICGVKYTTDFYLQVHIKGVHEGVKNKFACLVENCTAAFSRRIRLENHMKSHLLKEVFICSLCSLKFKTELRRDVHIQKIHYGISKCLACPICEKKFACVAKVEKHLRLSHEMTIADDELSHGGKRSSIIDTEKRPKPPKPFKCPACALRFDNEDLRYSHIQRKHNGITHPYKCDVCSKGFIQKSYMELHKQSHEKKALRPQYYQCEVEGCDKKYKKRFQLRLHVHDFHNDIRDFMCELCPVAYKSKKALAHHQARKHAKELGLPNFCCEECGKIFGASSTLKKHIEMIHKGIYKHYCTICNKGCFSEQGRIEHETLHTGKKLHNCEYCGKNFTWKDHFKQHLTIHTGEKKYHCDTCGEDFRDRTWFKRHQETHSGIIHYCQVCGKGFPIRHNLGIHMKSHANKNGRNNRELLKAQNGSRDNDEPTSSVTKCKERKTVTRKTRKRRHKKQDSDFEYSEEEEESMDESHSGNEGNHHYSINNPQEIKQTPGSSSIWSAQQQQIPQNQINFNPIHPTPQQTGFGYYPHYQRL